MTSVEMSFRKKKKRGGQRQSNYNPAFEIEGAKGQELNPIFENNQESERGSRSGTFSSEPRNVSLDDIGTVSDVTIADHKIVDTDREHLEFKLKIVVCAEGDDVCLYIWKRWTDFVDLGKRLKKIFPGSNFPELVKPRRGITQGKFDLRYVAVKKEALQKFLDGLFDSPGVVRCDEFVDFVTSSGSKVTTEEEEMVTLSAITKILANESFTEVTIRPGCVHTVTVTVTGTDKLVVWEFKSETYDMGCSVKLKPSVANSSTSVVMPLSRYASHNKMIQLTYQTPCPGDVTLEFDNTYSKIRAKDMKYRLRIIDKGTADKALEVLYNDYIEQTAKLAEVEPESSQNSPNGGETTVGDTNSPVLVSQEIDSEDSISTFSMSSSIKQRQARNRSRNRSSAVRMKRGSIFDRPTVLAADVEKESVDSNDHNAQGGSADVRVNAIKGLSGSKKISTASAKDQRLHRDLDALRKENETNKVSLLEADHEIELLHRRIHELESEFDEVMDTSRKRKDDVARLESANVALCEESDNATEKMLEAEKRAEEAERLHELCLEETDLHKQQIKELTERLIQSMEEHNEEKKTLNEEIEQLKDLVKEHEASPQKIKQRMEVEHSLRLQAEAEAVAAKNTAAKCRSELDDHIRIIKKLSAKLIKVSNQKKILIKAVEKYRQQETKTNDVDVVPNPNYSKKDARKASGKGRLSAIVDPQSLQLGHIKLRATDPRAQRLTEMVRRGVSFQVQGNNDSEEDGRRHTTGGLQDEVANAALFAATTGRPTTEQKRSATAASTAHPEDTRRNTPIFSDEMLKKGPPQASPQSSPRSRGKRRSTTQVLLDSFSQSGASGVVKKISEQGPAIINGMIDDLGTTLNITGQKSRAPEKVKVVKKSIDWGPLGTREMSLLIQKHICKGNDAHRKAVYNIWGHILDHKPLEEIQKVHPGGIEISRIPLKHAMAFLDVFIPHMRASRTDMTFKAQWIDANTKWGTKGANRGTKMWMGKVGHVASSKNNLVHVRIAMGARKIDEERPRTLSSGRYDD